MTKRTVDLLGWGGVVLYLVDYLGYGSSWLAAVGIVMLLVYAVQKKDPVFLIFFVGMSFNILVKLLRVFG